MERLIKEIIPKLRLYLIFVDLGLIILPDARSDIQWLKFNENSNKMNVINFTDQIRQQIVSRLVMFFFIR